METRTFITPTPTMNPDPKAPSLRWGIGWDWSYVSGDKWRANSAIMPALLST